MNAVHPLENTAPTADKAGNGANMPLLGKKALITGASGGIGSVMAQLFVQRGASVMLAGISEDNVRSLAQQLTAEAQSHGRKIACIGAPLDNPDAGDVLIKGTCDALGGIDILINNAGLTRDMLLMRMQDDAWQQVLDINLTAAMRLSRAAIRPMMRARSGIIVNISSVVASMGNGGQCNYAASKAGLEGFSRSLALEVASRNIRVNCIAPGFIETPMTAALSEEQKKAITHNIPLGSLGQPEDVAEAAAFLCSDAGRYITGETLHVNGGLYRA